MLKRITFLAFFLSLVAGTFAGRAWAIDFHRLHRERETERMLQDGNYAEALESAAGLAETAAGPLERMMWQSRAAVAMGHLEGRYEEALEYAREIEDRPYSVQARLEMMFSAEDYQGIVDTFPEEDIAGWPERELPRHPVYWRAPLDARALALYHRGRAFNETGDREAAAADLESADSLAADSRLRLNILTLLRDIYNRQDAGESLFLTNLKIAGLGGGGARYFRGLLAAASELRRRGLHEEALETVMRMNPRGRDGYWRRVSMLELGRIHAAAGHFEEAASVFRVIADENVGAVFLLAEALVSAGDREGAREVYREFLEREEISEDQRDRAREELEKLD